MNFNGPGKYDAACSLARAQTGAQAVALIVLNGHRGAGFSVQATDPKYIELLPDLLELMAKQIRQQAEGT